ncbi:protein of unknown function [Shewanella benthica]|uniref:Helix-turn-helix domain-containing protein n=1 Tax=Shewanella benthica TaxID=43661 RepID=A0A330M6F2_9GAMM|nr:hypothetical protein [Shewanella benthica]SQH76974.1 protein of unknown function [Shewanella benthica]
MLFDEQLLTATQTMKMLNVSRAHFYTKVIHDADFKLTVKPLMLVTNGQKQYRETEIVAFIDRKQEVA